MQVGSWPSGLWAPCGLPLIPLGSQQLPQVVVWVFAPASDFLPQPQPAPGCGDRIGTAPTSSAPNSPGKGGFSQGPHPQPVLPVRNQGRQMAYLSGCLWSSNQDEWGRAVGSDWLDVGQVILPLRV